jgi:hypothetical protein
MNWSAQISEAYLEAQTGPSPYVRVNCPACLTRTGKQDFKRSVSVSRSSGFWRCWKCDLRGRLPGEWGELEESEVSDEWEDVDLVEEPSDYVALDPEDPDPETLHARRYLRARRVDPALWRPARLGYARTGAHRHRIVFPIWDAAGESLGWVARSIGSTTGSGVPKYLTAAGMNRAECFYNDAEVSRETVEPLILTEGPLDALRHWPRAVAALGKPTRPQVERLRGLRRPVIVALDGDAWREGLGIAQALRLGGGEAYAVKLPAGADLDTLDVGAFELALRWALAEKSDVEVLP